MTPARGIMTPNPECIDGNEKLNDAARRMRDLDVGALPICGEENRLKAGPHTETSWCASSPRTVTHGGARQATSPKASR